MDQEVFSQLSHLWLSEPDDSTLAHAHDLLGLENEVPQRDELAQAYADLFFLNVYPYASPYLDLDGEMNGMRSQETQALYQRFGYQPESLGQVGAPDHMGLLLGLLAHVPQTDSSTVLNEFILDFAPVLCLSVERQPAVHPFYGALAVRTRQELFRALDGQSPATKDLTALQPGRREVGIELARVEESEELSLSMIVQSLLCPARSGIFLSRNRLGQWARRLGVPLAFGERYRLGLSVFEAAGLVERVSELLEWLELEVEAWDAAYAAWAIEVPAWERFAVLWRQRTASTRRLLAEIRSAYRAIAN